MNEKDAITIMEAGGIRERTMVELKVQMAEIRTKRGTHHKMPCTSTTRMPL